MPGTLTDSIAEKIAHIVRKYWGYDTLRPLQAEAIRAGIEHRDSLVVMPTGGGKSLCYQVPPEVTGGDRCDVVISPLISLMKDQVDGLNANGYPAAALHSGLTDAERHEIDRGIVENKFRLIFVAPERLLTPYFLQTISRLDVKAFAIDEAHCISQWGHDFRPEYRQLRLLKQKFPGASVHAYTATATPRVRQDIVDQLGLVNPNVLVGVFDRPNLVYRIIQKVSVESQVIEVVRRHPGEAAIVYCISRKDTEAMAAVLKANGIKADFYHAGMEPADRARVQEAFADETLDVVVATVAFGMGIDRSNVRCVIHAAMPKTVEHYQQETGRAGRDGLEAECVMFYSGQDFLRWDKLIAFSASKIDDDALRESTVAAQLELLSHVRRLCGSVRCRHRALSLYFGQDYTKSNCGACDICLGEVEAMADSTVIAQKILSCVARLQQRFGIGHVVQVLIGADTQLIRSFGHDSLTTYGLLRDMPAKTVQNFVYQLIDQGLLARTLGNRPILQLNDASITVMKGQAEARLIQPAATKVKKTRIEEASWENVDRGLFEHLREIRKQIAAERGVPAFVIFGDSTLRELAAVRPSSLASFANVRGIGERKLADLGQRMVDAIVSYCGAHELTMDHFIGATVVIPKNSKSNTLKEVAFDLFAQGQAVEDVAPQIGRARSTTAGYLVEYVAQRRPRDISAWVTQPTYQRVMRAATQTDGSLLKPIYDALNGEVPYEIIRIVILHAESQHAQ